MFPSTFQPTRESFPRFIGDGGFAMTRTAYENRDITIFSQEHQDQHDMPFISLQSIQRRVKATGEALVTPLAFPILNVFVNTAFSITNNGMQPVINDPKILTLGIRAGVALSGELFGSTARTFSLSVGNDIRFRLQDSQRDTRLAAWTVTW